MIIVMDGNVDEDNEDDDVQGQSSLNFDDKQENHMFQKAEFLPSGRNHKKR